MRLTMILVPAALTLALWGGAMAVSGFRKRNRLKLFSAAGVFTLLVAGAAVMMEFLTRPF